MKIALISEHTDPLAAHRGEPSQTGSVHAAALSRHLAKLGHRVTIYTRNNDPTLPSKTRMGRGVGIQHLPAGPGTADHPNAFGESLGRALAEDPPDVIHSFGWTNGLAAASVTRHASGDHAPPLVQSFESLGVTERRAGLPVHAERERLEATLAGEAHAVIVSGIDQVPELTRMGVPRERVRVVPHGVDTDFFSPEGATAGDWQHEKGRWTRVISVCGFRPRDGAETLVRAVARTPRTELLVLGETSTDLAMNEEPQRLARLTKEMGVESHIRLAGAVSRKELSRLLRSADIYASATGHADYGGALLEAMACGLPTVTTAVGVASDAVLNGTTGILLRAARPELFCRVIGLLATQDMTRTAYGIAGVDRVQSRFAWPRVAMETAQVYEDVTAPREEDDLFAADGD